MSKTTEEIKDEVAIEYGWKSWKSCYGDDGITNAMIDEVAERYAQSKTEAIRHLAGVNSELKKKTQELQEQNAVLINTLHAVKNLQSLIEYPKDTPIEHSGESKAIHQMFNVIDILLTKYKKS